MVGIPKDIKTSKDVKNLHLMALRNKIDKKEWKRVLTEMCTEVIYNLPVLETGVDYILIPYTEKEIPAKYGTAIDRNAEFKAQNMAWKAIKIFMSNPESIKSIQISGGYPKLVQVGMSYNEVNRMLRELK